MNKIGQAVASTKNFFGEVQVELKKCSWPTRPELYESTMVVIVSVLIVTAAVSFSDLVLMQVLRLLIK